MQPAHFPSVRLRAILFDYGGTLDGEASHWLDRFVDLYRNAGVELPIERIRQAFYAADDACYRHPRIAEAGLVELVEFHVAVQLAGLGLSSAALQRQLADRFVAASTSSLAASRGILQRLQPTFRLGVVSNFYGNVGQILHDAGFDPLLAVIADSHRVGLSKPDPGIYTWAVRQLALPTGAVMHVGDSYDRDVVAARNAGLRTAWLVAGPPSQQPNPPPDLMLRSLDELLAYLDVF
jgi:putative hydrolase of the HAD superfamily